MTNYIIGICIGITIYSLILTLAILYKNHSSYFIVETIDVILAGPIAWCLCVIGQVIIAPLSHMFHNKKRKPYNHKNKKYIAKVVQKIVQQYKNKLYHDDYFDFSRMMNDPYGDFAGWETLLIKKAKNENLNRKFCKLMHHQQEETIKELYKYFEVVTEDMMKQDNCDEFYISKYKNKELYRLREVSK